MHLEVRELRDGDLPEIESSLLTMNKEEIMAMTGSSFTELFQSQPSMKDHSEILAVDGDIVCVGGSMDTQTGLLVWLFGTDKIEKHKRQFIKAIADRMNSLKAKHDLLYSYVFTKNTVTKEWLKMMGFSIFDGEPMGQNNEVFHYFEWRKECA